MLGNASGRLGECLGMLRGGLGRLGPLWASASQPKGCFWSTFLHFYGPASQPAKRMTGLFYPQSAFGAAKPRGSQAYVDPGSQAQIWVASPM